MAGWRWCWLAAWVCVLVGSVLPIVCYDSMFRCLGYVGLVVRWVGWLVALWFAGLGFAGALLVVCVAF